MSPTVKALRRQGIKMDRIQNLGQSHSAIDMMDDVSESAR